MCSLIDRLWGVAAATSTVSLLRQHQLMKCIWCQSRGRVSAQLRTVREAVMTSHPDMFPLEHHSGSVGVKYVLEPVL